MFPGTIGLRVFTFEKVLEDIAESLKLALFYRPDRPWPRTLP